MDYLNLSNVLHRMFSKYFERNKLCCGNLISWWAVRALSGESCVDQSEELQVV